MGAQHNMRLTILSQNIWNKNYHWEKRKPLIINLIKELNPDIICLQEIYGKSKRQNQQAELLQELPQYNSSLTVVRRKSSHINGMGILTRGKILYTEEMALTLPKQETIDIFPRYLAHHKVSMQGKQINILHTHLSFGEIGRSKNLEELAEYLNELKDLEKTFLVGDFNAPDADKSLERFTGQTFRNRRTYDLGAIAKNLNPTWPISRKLVHDNWNLKHPNEKLPWEIIPARMDRIFSFSKPKSLKHSLVKKQKKNSYHSDHYGVFVEIEF